MNDAYWLLDRQEVAKKYKMTQEFMNHLVENAMGKGLQDTAGEKKYSFLDSLLKQTSAPLLIRGYFTFLSVTKTSFRSSGILPLRTLVPTNIPSKSVLAN